MSAGRIILLILGIVVILVSFGLMIAGGAIIWADQSLKDEDGFINTRTARLVQDSYAIVTEPADIRLEAGRFWDWGNLLTLRIQVSNNIPGRQAFAGIAPESDLQAYLNGVEYDEVTDFSLHPYNVEYRRHPGDTQPAPPAAQTFWRASASGSGNQTLEWQLEEGNFSLALMNADGSEGIDMDAVFGARVPSLVWIGVGFLAAGLVVLGAGTLFIYLSLRRPRTA